MAEISGFDILGDLDSFYSDASFVAFEELANKGRYPILEETFIKFFDGVKIGELLISCSQDNTELLNRKWEVSESLEANRGHIYLMFDTLAEVFAHEYGKVNKVTPREIRSVLPKIPDQYMKSPVRFLVRSNANVERQTRAEITEAFNVVSSFITFCLAD